jgi:murein L,D-transpeptidase YcbB/YkuD
MRTRIVPGWSSKPAGRLVRPAGFAMAAVAALIASQPAAAAPYSMARAERAMQAEFQRPDWAAQGDDRAAEALIDLLATARLDGLEPSQFKVASLRKALRRLGSEDSDDVAATKRVFDQAFVRYVTALRSGAAHGWVVVDSDLAPGRETPKQILARAAAAPSLADYVANMAFMPPAYAELRRSIQWGELEDRSRYGLVRLNMDRLRMLPATGRYVLVNAAAQRLEMIDNGRVVDQMKVVVGKAKNPTPVMAAFIRYAALNPYWEVPPDLAAERIAPNVVNEGLGYLKKHGYVVLSDWGASPQTIDPSTVDWKAVADGTIQIRVRQNPGPYNAMGRMKFMFPNREGVYLHDTPDKQLLQEAARLFSGGCVRLEDAPRLSKWMFGETLNPKGAGPDERVDLDKPIPVYIAYLTAMPEDGRIAFYDDIYGRDQAALAEQGGSEPGSQLSSYSRQVATYSSE